MLLTEECFGKSGINLFNHVINQQGPFSEFFKYLRDNNSPIVINNAMDKFLAYLLENGFTCENLKDPNFLIDYLANDDTEIEGMVGGMPVKPLVVAVLITFNVASGNVFTAVASGSMTTAGILLKRTLFAGHYLCKGLVETAIPAVRTVGDVGWEIGSAVNEVYEKVLKSPNQQAVEDAEEDARKAMAAAAALAEKVRLLEEAAAAKDKADKDKAKADKDFNNKLLAGSLLAVSACVFSYSRFNTNCKDKTGPLPLVNYNKIARSRPVKYRFSDGYNSEYTFPSLEEACTAVSEGYPLYVKRGEIWMKLTRWDDLIYCFDNSEVVATKNHEMPRRGGTKRRKKRRSTRRR